MQGTSLQSFIDFGEILYKKNTDDGLMTAGDHSNSLRAPCIRVSKKIPITRVIGFFCMNLTNCPLNKIQPYLDAYGVLILQNEAVRI